MPYNSILFFLFHCYLSDVVAMKVQLGQPNFLVPTTYEQFIKVDQVTGLVSRSLFTDSVSYYVDTPVLWTFWMTFGEFCSVTDQIVEDVLNTIDRVKLLVPTAIQRLPRDIQRTYFPRFYSGNYTVFDYFLPDVGDCNRECRPIPPFQSYFGTENGIRQMRRYAYNEYFDYLPVIGILRGLVGV